MNNYIQYINALKACAEEHKNDTTPFAHIIVSKLCNDVADLLEKLEPMTGHWERDEDWHYHCDVCGAKAPSFWTDGEGFDRMVTPYCPQCGAEMEKWEDADEEWYVHRDEVYGKAESEE